MSLSKYLSTVETTNTARLARLVLGPCTDVLRDILKKEIPPINLSKAVKQLTDDLKKNKKRCPFNTAQIEIILPPPSNHYGGDYSDLDISLLYTIFRNVTKISPPSKGWGEYPDPADRSVAANIERIRLLRNKYYGHSADISLSDSEFRQEWRNIRDIVVELELRLGSSTVYQDAVTDVKTCSMDPELEQKYISRLGVVEELHSNVLNVSGALLSVKKELNMCTESLETINKTHKTDPKIEREIETTTTMVESHHDEMTTVMVKTRAFERARQLLENNRYVIIKGTPGSGKTTLAKCLLKASLDQGKRPLQIFKMSKLYGRVSPFDNLAIFIDNAFGELTFFKNDFIEFVNKKDIIESLLKFNTSATGNILILTIRSDIYFEILDNQKQQNLSSVIDLSRGKYALNTEEMNMFFNSYNIPQKIRKDLILRQSELYSTLGCPQCCKLAQENPEFGNDISSFLSCPSLFLKSYMENLIAKRAEKMVALIYILLKGGSVESSLLANEKDRNVKSIALKILDLNPLLIGKFYKRVQYFDGFLTIYDKINDSYTFSNTSVQEILFSTMIAAFPEEIIQNCHHILLRRLTTSKNHKRTQTLIDKEMFKNVASRIKRILKDSSPEGYVTISVLNLWDDKRFFEYFTADHKCNNTMHECVDSKGNSIMVYFAKSGHFDWMVHLLQTTFNELQRYRSLDEKQKYRSLNAACGENHLEIVDLILSFGVRNDLSTCFHTVQSGNIDLLLKMCRSVDVSQTGLSLVSECANVHHSLIQEVCYSRQFHLLLPLIEQYPGFIEKTALDGQTILHYTSQSGEYDICKFLVINYPQLIEIKSKEGCTVLHSACISGDKKLILFLIEKGLDINALTNSGESVLHISSENGQYDACEFFLENFPHLIDIKDTYGYTALHCASISGDKKLLSFLITKGLDVKEMTQSGENALHIACLHGQYDACRFFITKYPQLIDVKLDTGYSVLHLACLNGNKKLVSYLIGNGSDINDLTNDGESVLHIACCDGMNDACEYLVTNYTQLFDIKSKAGFTALHIASRSGDKKLISFLLANSLDVTALTKTGKSVLHIACLNGKYDACEFLVTNNPQLLAIKDNHGYTALHSACVNGNKNVISFLIEKGLNINTLTKDGKSGLHLACHNGNYDACEYIVTFYPQLLDIKDDEGYSALHYACIDGNTKIISFLAEKMCDTNAMNDSRLLHVACQYGNYDACTYFANNYPQLLEVKDKNGYTALHSACVSGNNELISFLIEKGLDINAMTNTKKSVLHIACLNERLDTCKYFVAKYPQLIDFKDNDGCTALHSACLNEETDIISLLLEKGMDINALTNTGECVIHIACRHGKYSAIAFFVINYPQFIDAKDDKGLTPFHSACINGDEHLISFLIEKGFDINALTKDGESVLDIACAYRNFAACEYFVYYYPELLDGKDINGYTALHNACIGGDNKLISFLIEKGSDINALTNIEENVLHIACRYGKYAACEYLIANYPQLIYNRDIDEYTILHNACISGDKKLISFLIGKGLDMNALTNTGDSVLHIACEYGKYDASEYLVDNYPQLIDVKNIEGYTALHSACTSGNNKLISFLVEKGFDINMRTKIDESVLHIACLMDEYETCEFLLTNYAQLIEFKDNEGFSALHSAGISGNKNLISLLITKGLDVNGVSDSGQSVLHVACICGRYDACEFLVNNYPQLIDLRDNGGNTSLQYACDNGDEKMISFLARKSSHLNSIWTFGKDSFNINFYKKRSNIHCMYVVKNKMLKLDK